MFALLVHYSARYILAIKIQTCAKGKLSQHIKIFIHKYCKLYNLKTKKKQYPVNYRLKKVNFIGH